MALTKRSTNSRVYLEAKYFCLWQGLKEQTEGCDIVDAPNPRTGGTVRKYGHRFDTVTGRAVKLVKYDTADKYQARYFGFEMHLVDGADAYVLKMPYQSAFLRRFLRVAKNIDWSVPLSITVFKGRGQENEEETGIWFQQRGETVKPYYTRENPHGMPSAIYDDQLRQWDFKEQHRWLVKKLQEDTMPAIEAAGQSAAPPVEREQQPQQPEVFDDDQDIPPHYIADDQEGPDF